MTFIDRPLPATLELPRLVDRPRDKRLDNLRHGPGIGRPAGVQDKITRDLKQGLLEGAIAHGYDGEGEDGLVGYCHHLAERHPKMYCHLLAKLLPYNLNANVDGTAPGRGITTVVFSTAPSGLCVGEDGKLTTADAVKSCRTEMTDEPPFGQSDDPGDNDAA